MLEEGDLVPSDKKKIFVSWSKEHSKQIALVLKEYLPQIVDGIDVFMSDKDIDPGERSMKTIESELAGTSYGLLIVTADNQNEAWLNFEAGALSKQVGKDDEDVPRVVPVLVNIPNAAQLVGPIGQFQAVKLTEEDLRKTVMSIASLAEVDVEITGKKFNRTWPEIQQGLTNTGASDQGTDTLPIRTTDEKLDEALEILRSVQRALPVMQAHDRAAFEEQERKQTEILYERSVRLLASLVERAGGKLRRTNQNERGDLIGATFTGPSTFPEGEVVEQFRKATGRKINLERVVAVRRPAGRQDEFNAGPKG